MDGHPRQNPAYRPATEKALETGLFLWSRFAGDSSGSPRGGLTAVSVEPPGTVAQRRLARWAGYESLRNAERNISHRLARRERERCASRLVNRVRSRACHELLEERDTQGRAPLKAISAPRVGDGRSQHCFAFRYR